jgi:type I site-specific restriction endonuclease
LHARGWTEDFICREETAGAIEIVDGRPRKQSRGRIDYTLRIRINPNTQPVALALIEAKAERLPPMHGLEQGKLYASWASLACLTLTCRVGRSWRETSLVQFRVLRRIHSSNRRSEKPLPRVLNRTTGRLFLFL